MRAVLYADDMEPITVVELPEFAEEYLAERGMVRLAVMRPPEWVIPATQPPKFEKLTTVTIVAERLVRNGRAHMGYSQRAAARALGMSLPGYQRMERGADFATGKPVEIDRRTALACGAIAAGIGEYQPQAV